MNLLSYFARLAFLATIMAGTLSMNAFSESEPLSQRLSSDTPLRVPATKVFNLNNPERVPNQYIVVFKDGMELAKDVPMSVARTLNVAPGALPTTINGVSEIGLSMAEKYRSVELVEKSQQGNLRRIRHVYSDVFRGFSVDGISEQNVLLMAQDPRVRYVDSVLKAHLSNTAEEIQTNGGITCNSLAPVSCTPVPCVGPTSACAPWDLDRLDQITGLDGKYHYYSTGAGVTIWVIDTGLQFSHTDFGGRAGNSVIEIDSNGSVADTPVVSTVGTNDVCGHGTAVASAAAGKIAGTAKGATLIGVNIYTTYADDCDTPTTTSQLIAAFDYVIANKANGPNVINFSLEVSPSASGAPSFETAVFQAISSGITVVAAAGNDNGQNACSYDPGRLLGVIAVGATSQIDSLSGYSNNGACIALLAPGDHVIVADNGNDNYMDGSANHCGNPQYSNLGYCTISGTSFAAPLVSGIAALYLQHNPSASPGQVYSVLRSSAVKNVVSLVPGGTSNLLASVWVPGNYSGTGPQSPGGGVPPGTAALVLPTILDLLLGH